MVNQEALHEIEAVLGRIRGAWATGTPQRVLVWGGAILAAGNLMLDLARPEWVLRVAEQSLTTFVNGGYHVALDGMTVAWCVQLALTPVLLRGLGVLTRDLVRAINRRYPSAAAQQLEA